MTAVVLFWLTIIVPNQKPIEFEEEVASLAECQKAVELFLTHPSHKILIEGGQVGAGCVFRVAPSEEH